MILLPLLDKEHMDLCNEHTTSNVILRVWVDILRDTMFISHIVPNLKLDGKESPKQATTKHTGDKEIGIYGSCNGAFFHKSEKFKQ